MTRKTEEAKGWGLRVGGCRPYLAWDFSVEKENIEAKCGPGTYCRPVKAVLLPLGEFNRLKRNQKDTNK